MFFIDMDGKMFVFVAKDELDSNECFSLALNELSRVYRNHYEYTEDDDEFCVVLADYNEFNEFRKIIKEYM